MTIALVRADAITTHAVSLVDGEQALAKVHSGQFQSCAGRISSLSLPWPASTTLLRCFTCLCLVSFGHVPRP